MMWVILFGGLFILSIAGVIFLISRIRCFSIISKLSKGRKWVEWLLDDRFYLVGRQDASEELDFGGSRASVEELTQNLDKSKYSIVLDHQPREYSEDAKAGVDMVLSGHTHGGQMIPWVQLDRMFHWGGDDNVYGKEQWENTNYIVTSGISDWAIKFKTGCRSEYAIIDIEAGR